MTAFTLTIASSEALALHDAFIFDCDGTLADSMPAHYDAWCFALTHCGAGFTFDEPTFYGLGGMPSWEIVDLLNRRHGTRLLNEDVMKAKEEGYLRALAKVAPIPPVVELAGLARQAGKPAAVASGGIRPVVLQTLQAIGMADRFPVVVTADDVRRHKPSPDIFLLAAEKLGVSPERCLVLEDSPLGEQAARAAGMSCAMVKRAI